MNKKILLIALITLTVAMLVVPVMAVPTGTGQVVPASQVTIGMLPGSYTITPTNGGIVYFTGTEIYFGILTINGQDYNIYSYNDVKGILNTKTGLNVNKGEAVWYVTATPYTVEESSDGFAGTALYSLTEYNPITGTYSWIKVHALVHGFGMFEGQTLELSYAGATNGVWTGICVKG